MKNELLRHVIATIKYRFEKSVNDSLKAFGSFSAGQGSRSAKEIIHHMYDVLYSTRYFIENEELPTEQPHGLTFTREIERFRLELETLDQVLASEELPLSYAKRLIQGPFSDLLTHLGQIAMLQRLYGNPIDGEDFSKASIKTGLD